MDSDLRARSTSQPAFSTCSLSVQLRNQTASLHRQTERLLGLPGSIRTRDDYVAWLGRFFGLYAPLEQMLTKFAEWGTIGPALPLRSHSACIASDLASLKVELGRVQQISSAALPDLPTFPHALGALYVLEGATLGGRLILSDIEARLDAPIAGATQFFGGRGEQVGPIWQCFRERLNNFGNEHPKLSADVVVGAERVFRTMLAWFAPFCADRP